MCRVGRASALALALLALAFIPAQHAAAQDAPGDASTTVRFAVPGVLDETITPASDTDVFLVPLVSGGVYQFETRRRGNVTLDTTLGLYPPGHTDFGAITAGTSDCFNASGVLAFNDDTGVGVSQITWTATQTGDHLLCVDSFGSGVSMGGYRLTATVTTAPPVPNLAATSATFAGSPPTANEAGATVTLLDSRQSGLTLDVEVANAGDASTNAMIQVYRAPNARDAGSPPTAPGCGGANVLCRAGQPRTVGAFASGGATPQTSGTFTASTDAGLYHYFACFTDASETANLTDNCTPSIPARVGGADLSVTVAVDRNLTVSSGATTPATASVTNNGAAFFRFEGGLTVNFYRSGPLAGTDPVPGLPTPLGSSVGMFSTGASFNVNAAGVTEPAADTLIPSTPGTYYYFACATSAALPAAICSEASPSVTVTIAGALTFGGDLTGEVTEDAADMNMATGTLTVTNPGSGGTDVVVQDAADGMYGLFSIGATGNWTYTLGGNTANDNAVNALAAGIEMDDTFTITAVAGGTVDVTITVTGANDAPTALIATVPAQVDFGADVAIVGSATDPDTGATFTYAWNTRPANTGSFADAAAASTTWTAPTSGTDPVVLILTVTDDGSPGLSDTAEATITPVVTAVTFGGATTGSVTEDAGTTTTTGTLTLTTTAGNKNVIRQTDRLGTYGRFTITPNRVWTYTLDNALADAVPGNMTARDVFTVVAAANPAATVDVVITVIGNNDAPVAVITSPAFGTRVGFGGTLIFDGSNSYDPDTGETETLRRDWQRRTLPLSGTFDDRGAPVTIWRAPASGTEQPGTKGFGLVLLDRHDQQTLITVNIQLVNGTFTITGDQEGAVAEDGVQTATGTVLVTNDSNGNTPAFTARELLGSYGRFSVTTGGVWTYTLGGGAGNPGIDTALNALAAGQVELERFYARSTVDALITIMVTGANDAPTVAISAPTDGMQVDFGTTVTLTATGEDPDAGATLTYAWTASPNVGSFAATTSASTTWTAPSSGAAPVTLTLTVTDDTGATGTAEVTVNPTAVAVTFGGATTGARTEDAGGGDATGTLTITTASSNKNVIAQTGTPGTYGAFSVTEPGVWSYTLDNADADTNALAEGVEMTDTFTVTASANSAFTVDVVITVTGANDPPTATISAPTDGIQVAFGSAVTLTATGEDPDTGQTATLTYEWTANPDVGSFANAAAASTTWTVPASGTDPVTLTLTATDDDATTPLARTAQVTVNPVAVAITFPGGTTGGINEGDTSITRTLTVTSSGSNTNVVAQTAVSGIYGTFAIDANGRWTYTLDNTNAAINPLAAGATLDDPFTVVAAANADATVVITITITGVNDAPTVEITAPATNGMQVDFGSVVTLTATASDPDTGATLTYAWTANPNVGSFADATAEDTTWTAPSSGTAAVTLTLTATDNATPPATGTAQVIVNPTAVSVTFTGSVITGSVTEDAATTAVGGALAIITTSTNKNVVPIVATAPESMGTYGTFTITAPGAWTYTLDNTATATDRLPGGTIVEDTFTVTASANPTATVDVTIRVTGANDDPTVTIDRPVPPMTGTFSVISGRQVTLEATGADVDLSANLTYTWTTNPANQGTFTSATAADTTWNPPTVTGNTNITLTVTVSDNFPSNPATDSADFALIVTEGPSVAGDGIGEDGVDAVGNCTSTTCVTYDNNGDTATDTLMVSNIPTNPATSEPFPADHSITRQPTYGTAILAPVAPSLTRQIEGDEVRWTYTLDLNDPDTIALAAGANVVDTFDIRTTIDDIRIDRTVSVSLSTVTFLDDAPTATVMINGSAGASATVDEGAIVTLTGGGTDPEGDAITAYAWTHTTQTENPTVTLSAATGQEVTFTAPDERVELTFTLIVTANGMTSPALTIEVQVGRSSERALQKTLAAFGRAFAADAVDMISGHLADNGPAATNRFTLGGQEITAAVPTHTSAAPPVIPTQSYAPAVIPAQAGIQRGHTDQSNPWGDIWQDDNPSINYMSTRALLEKSAFHYTLSDPDGSGSVRSVWGRATFGNFEGRPDNLTLDGDLRSAYLGLDYHASQQRQGGVAISHTEGDVDYTDNANNNNTGNLEAELTSVLPYMRWTTDSGLGVWGLLGYGTGDATLNEDGRDPTETDIEMRLAAGGVRGALRSLQHSELAWKASAFAVEMESDAVASQGLPSVNAESQRLRLALEGRRTSGKSSGGKWLIPGWELGLRWDDGDAESGAGADLGLSLQYTNPADGWQVQVRSRYLVVHEESDYKEWSASVEARKDFGNRNRGLALTLTPDWNQRESSQRVGLDFSGLINSKWRTDSLRLEVYGERRQRKDDAPGHEVGLSGELRF